MTPSRSLLCVAALALPLSLLAGCGGGSPDGEEPSGAPEAVVLSADDLMSVLTTAGEVPEGFLQRDPEDEDSPIFDGTCLGEVKGFDEIAGDPAEKADTEFVTEDENFGVTSSASSYDDVAQAGDAMTSFADQLDGCTSVEVTTPDGVTLAFEVSIDDDVTVSGADQQLTLNLSGTVTLGDQSAPASLEGIATRLGNNMTTVLTNEIGTTGNFDVLALATAQLERLQALID